ncbi:MAG: hypothetical protein Q9M37_08375 [Desulfonauticus sp.]|nr:hypothetical protein [Desulfonauticus sp.]
MAQKSCPYLQEAYKSRQLFFLSLLFACVLHLLVLTFNFNILNKFLTLAQNKSKNIIQVDLQDKHKLFLKILKITAGTFTSPRPLAKPVLAQGIKKYHKISVQDKKLNATLLVLKRIIGAFWVKENINTLGRAVVRFHLKQGQIVDFFISEWQGQQEFLTEIFQFLQKIQAVNFQTKGNIELWFSCEFATQPDF